MFLCALGYVQRGRFLSGRNDFVQLYTGARLSGTADLYEPEANKRVHMQALGVWLKSVYYSRLPFYAFLLRPLSKLPYLTAYWIYLLLGAAALVGFLRIWWPRCRELPLFAAFSVPLLANILTGQDLAFVLFGAALAIECLRRKRDFPAGLLFAACAIKIHLLLLIPVVLLVHRKWRALAGGLAGGAVITALCFWSDGVEWPMRYLAALRNPDLHPGAEHMPTLRGLMHAVSGYDAPLWSALLSLAVLAAVIFIARRSHLELSLGCALIGSLLCGYHAYLQDCSILLLAFVLVMEWATLPLLRVGMALVVTPPVFVLLSSGTPWNGAVPLSLLAVLGIAAFDARRRRAISGEELPE